MDNSINLRCAPRGLGGLNTGQRDCSIQGKDTEGKEWRRRANTTLAVYKLRCSPRGLDGLSKGQGDCSTQGNDTEGKERRRHADTHLVAYGCQGCTEKQNLPMNGIVEQVLARRHSKRIEGVHDARRARQGGSVSSAKSLKAANGSRRGLKACSFARISDRLHAGDTQAQDPEQVKATRACALAFSYFLE